MSGLTMGKLSIYPVEIDIQYTPQIWSQMNKQDVRYPSSRKPSCASSSHHDVSAQCLQLDFFHAHTSNTAQGRLANVRPDGSEWWVLRNKRVTICTLCAQLVHTNQRVWVMKSDTAIIAHQDKYSPLGPEVWVWPFPCVQLDLLQLNICYPVLLCPYVIQHNIFFVLNFSIITM